VAKHGKKYRQAAEKVELRPYPLKDAIELAGRLQQPWRSPKLG